MILKPEINMILEAHARWLTNFHEILHGHRTFELKEINSTNCCTLGDWLDKEGRSMLEPELHREICTAHQDFHRIAGEVILKIRNKQFAEAKKDIGPNGALRKASFRLKKLLGQLVFQAPFKAAEEEETETSTAANEAASADEAAPEDAASVTTETNAPSN